MKLVLALGAACATLTAAAYAQTDRVVIRHGGHAELGVDANNDGWVTREEASTAADRMFDHLDSNDDGRLDGEDRRAFRVHFDAPEIEVLEGDDGERRIRVITRAAERAERDAERTARDSERRVAREVIVIRSEDGEWTEAPTPPTPPAAPTPPAPPRPPMFMMLIANSEEADLNGDGALSRDEFRAQHLRFFDASDANGDGRIRFEPPIPPEPPAPPAPPEPPRPR